MPTPINNQGTLSTDPNDCIIFTCPDGRNAVIKKITFHNEANHVLSVFRVIKNPDPVYINPISVLAYKKTLDGGDTVTDDTGYELAAANALSAYSDIDGTTYVIEGYTEQA